MANGIVMFALFASDALGVFVPVLFVNENSTKDDFFRMILVESCIIIGIHILMLLFFRGKPPTPAKYTIVIIQLFKRSKERIIPQISERSRKE